MKIFKTGWSEGYDGPGRRWIIYLKGCNFRCRWCANPEGIALEDEILFCSERSQHAESACSRAALKHDSSGVTLDRSECALCEERTCVNVWRHPAFELAGTELQPSEIESTARRYIPMFGADGGVTFGGGEPALQPDDLLNALARLREAEIHTAVETNAGTEAFKRLIGRVALLICDLKCAGEITHKEWTGSSRKIVRENLLEAARRQQELWVRIPFVPGLNDDPVEMQAITDELAAIRAARPGEMRPLRVEVLRMHHLGEPKYRALGLEYPMSGAKEPSVRICGEFAGMIRKMGIECVMV